MEIVSRRQESGYALETRCVKHAINQVLYCLLVIVVRQAEGTFMEELHRLHHRRNADRLGLLPAHGPRASQIAEKLG